MEGHLRVDKLSSIDLEQHYYKALPESKRCQARVSQTVPCKFSPDTLLDRVLYLSSADDEFCVGESVHERAKMARATAQVCRRWRQRALNTPSIWLGPVLSWYSHPAWLSIVLERSNPLPFPAFIPYEALERYPADTLLVILKHLPRIQHLDMTVGFRLWQMVIESKYLEQQAPCLQTFNLSIADESERRKISIPEQENLFGGWAPLLRQFRVEHCPINLARKMYSGLQGLYLDVLHLIPPVQLLNALQNMPHLEHLHLTRRPGNPRFIVDTPDLPPIHLAKLQDLQVSDSASVSAGVLKNLRFPSSCSIRLRIYHASDGRYLREIRKQLRNSLSEWGCEPLTGRLILTIGATSLTFTVEAPDVDQASDMVHPHVSLAFSWEPDTSSSTTLLSLFTLIAPVFQSCEAPPDTLVVYSDLRLPTQMRNQFSKWLRKMDTIQSLELHTNAAFSLLKLRLEVSDDDTSLETLSIYGTFDEDEEPVLLPFLTDLILVDVNFPSERRRYWKRLMSTLKLRQDTGYPLMLVDFVHCVGEIDLRDVGRYVAEVKKDGEDYDELDDSDEDTSGCDSDYTIQADSDIE